MFHLGSRVYSISKVCVVHVCACVCVRAWMCEVIHLMWLQVLEELGLDEEDLVDEPVVAHLSSPPVSPPGLSLQLPSSPAAPSDSQQQSE